MTAGEVEEEQAFVDLLDDDGDDVAERVAVSLPYVRDLLDQDFEVDKLPAETPRDYYIRVSREVLHRFATCLKVRGMGKHMPKTKVQVLHAICKLVMLFNESPPWPGAQWSES